MPLCRGLFIYCSIYYLRLVEWIRSREERGRMREKPRPLLHCRKHRHTKGNSDTKEVWKFVPAVKVEQSFQSIVERVVRLYLNPTLVKKNHTRREKSAIRQTALSGVLSCPCCCIQTDARETKNALCEIILCCVFKLFDFSPDVGRSL